MLLHSGCGASLGRRLTQTKWPPGNPARFTRGAVATFHDRRGIRRHRAHPQRRTGADRRQLPGCSVLLCCAQSQPPRRARAARQTTVKHRWLLHRSTLQLPSCRNTTGHDSNPFGAMRERQCIPKFRATNGLPKRPYLAACTPHEKARPLRRPLRCDLCWCRIMRYNAAYFVYIF